MKEIFRYKVILKRHIPAARPDVCITTPYCKLFDVINDRLLRNEGENNE